MQRVGVSELSLNRFQPIKNGVHSRDGITFRQLGAVNHHHWKVQSSRRGQLGLSPGAASVFANHNLDTLVLKQLGVACDGERTARHNHSVMRQGRRLFRRIHQAQDIVMLRLRGERGHVQTPQRQHDLLGGPVQRGDCTGDIGHVSPIVPFAGLPFRPLQGQQRHVRRAAGMEGIPAHLCCKRVCGINHMADVMLVQIGDQTVNTAKAANTMGNGLRTGMIDTARIGKGRLNATAGQALRECAGFGCAAENKEIGAHV